MFIGITLIKLTNKVAIVTGATSGIGEAIAFTLAEEGASVVVSGRNKERGLTLEKKIIKKGYKATFISCDTTEEAQVKELIIKTLNKYGKIDILINNAGNFVTGSLESYDSLDWDNTFNVNVKGYYLMCKYTMPSLIESGDGIIINNASIAGMQSFASGQTYAYSSSKAAVVQLSRVMAKNYAKDNVRVNTICPGIIKTPIFKEFDESKYNERVPLGRVGVAEDVANVVTFLCTREASYLTGIVLPIDGGLSI